MLYVFKAFEVYWKDVANLIVYFVNCLWLASVLGKKNLGEDHATSSPGNNLANPNLLVENLSLPPTSFVNQTSGSCLCEQR